MENYRRFYAIVRNLGLEEQKEMLVKQYTGGRTSHLHRMKTAEYNALCDALEAQDSRNTIKQKLNRQLKQKRSAVLHQMQKMGIDTSDWENVNRFCREPRICGKEFRLIEDDELDQLLVKLRAIERKGELMKRVTVIKKPTSTTLKVHFSGDEIKEMLHKLN